VILTSIAPYVAVAVTVIVWTLTQRANRKHEIFKERLKRRVEMFDGLLPEISKFIDALKQYNGDDSNTEAVQACQEACEKLGSYRVKMLCYGTDEERHVYEEYVDCINQRRIEVLEERNKTLVDLIRKNLRTELAIK
jgi:hypothetical protein